MAAVRSWMHFGLRLASLSGPKVTHSIAVRRACVWNRRPPVRSTFQERTPTGSNYCFGTGIGRMLETFQPSAVLRSTWFIRNVVVCAG